MNNTRIRLVSSGIRALLKSNEVQSECIRYAHNTANNKKGNYKVVTRKYPERVGAVVLPADAETYYKNHKK